MYPGMWTSILVELSPADAVRTIAEVGWPAVELSTEHIAMLAHTAQPEAECEALRVVVEDLQLRMPQVHLMIEANLVHPDANLREEHLATCLRHVQLAALMGIEVGVIHPGASGPRNRQEFEAERRRRVESFRRLAEYAATRNFSLAIENMNDGPRAARGYRGQRGYGCLIGELHEIIDDIGLPNVGICYDTGHGNLQGLVMAEAVRECGDRLIATHITDNDGSGDQHRTPFYGKVDWQEGVAALREIGYQGIFNLEVPGERGLPVEQMRYRLQYALSITNWLLGR